MGRKAFCPSAEQRELVTELAASGASEAAIAAEIGCSVPTLRKYLAPELTVDRDRRRLDAPLQVIALGAGVQSTTMVLMAARAELKPMPQLAIFADTHAEPSFVYDHLAWMQALRLPFSVQKIDGGDLAEDLINGRFGAADGVYPSIPLFLDTASQGGGRGVRGCTGPYKTRPIAREIRNLLGPVKGGHPRPGAAQLWLGISTDEAHRMKPSPHQWLTHRFPLIEASMSRGDCVRWLERNGYPIPERSACTFCPYHSDVEWRRLRQLDPGGFERAIQVDAAMRTNREKFGLTSTPYLHRSMKPLDEIDFAASARGPDLFGEECSGLCGG